MKTTERSDRKIKTIARLYAVFFNVLPPLIGCITFVLCITVSFVFLERLFAYLILCIGIICLLLPKLLEGFLMMDLYANGDLKLYRAVTRTTGSNHRFSQYLIGECSAGEYQYAINVATACLKQKKWNRKRRYAWLNVLAYCYFELGDDQKLLLVCDAFDRISKDERNAALLQKSRPIFERYRAYAQRDAVRCRMIIDRLGNTKYPIDTYYNAFYRARVLQYVFGDTEAARQQYAKATGAANEYSFVRLAKQEMQAMEQGERYTDSMPEVLPDEGFVPRAGREYTMVQSCILGSYTIVMIIIASCSVMLIPKLMDMRTESNLKKLLEQDYISVQQLDCFNIDANDEVADSMFVCVIDESVVVGSEYITNHKQIVYQLKYSVRVSDLQNPNYRLSPIRHICGLEDYEITSAFFRSYEEIPEHALYVASIEIDGATYYLAVLDCVKLP